MATGRLQAAGDRRGVVELPDLEARADGQPIAVHGQAHRLAEAAEVRVDALAVGAEHHQLAGLVGRPSSDAPSRSSSGPKPAVWLLRAAARQAMCGAATTLIADGSILIRRRSPTPKEPPKSLALKVGSLKQRQICTGWAVAGGTGAAVV